MVDTRETVSRSVDEDLKEICKFEAAKRIVYVSKPKSTTRLLNNTATTGSLMKTNLKVAVDKKMANVTVVQNNVALPDVDKSKTNVTISAEESITDTTDMICKDKVTMDRKDHLVCFGVYITPYKSTQKNQRCVAFIENPEKKKILDSNATVTENVYHSMDVKSTMITAANILPYEKIEPETLFQRSFGSPMNYGSSEASFPKEATFKILIGDSVDSVSENNISGTSEDLDVTAELAMSSVENYDISTEVVLKRSISFTLKNNAQDSNISKLANKCITTLNQNSENVPDDRVKLSAGMSCDAVLQNEGTLDKGIPKQKPDGSVIEGDSYSKTSSEDSESPEVVGWHRNDKNKELMLHSLDQNKPTDELCEVTSEVTVCRGLKQASNIFRTQFEHPFMNAYVRSASVQWDPNFGELLVKSPFLQAGLDGKALNMETPGKKTDTAVSNESISDTMLQGANSTELSVKPSVPKNLWFVSLIREPFDLNLCRREQPIYKIANQTEDTLAKQDTSTPTSKGMFSFSNTCIDQKPHVSVIPVSASPVVHETKESTSAPLDEANSKSVGDSVFVRTSLSLPSWHTVVSAVSSSTIHTQFSGLQVRRVPNYIPPHARRLHERLVETDIRALQKISWHDKANMYILAHYTKMMNSS